MSGAFTIRRDDVPAILSTLSSAKAEFEGGIQALPSARDSLLSGNTPLGQAEQQIQTGMTKIMQVMEQIAMAVQTKGGVQFGGALEDWNRVVQEINTDIADVQRVVKELGTKIDELKHKLDSKHAALEQDASVFNSYLQRMEAEDHL